MRILIITHPRSGGLSLSLWLSKELEFNLYHEPFNVESKNDIDLNVFMDKKCVVKIFPFELDKYTIDIKNFIGTFDKVIIHKRDNSEDVAISLVWAVLNNKTPEDWHQTYETDEKWVNNNHPLLTTQLYDVKCFQSYLDNLIVNKSLKTTYDEIFESKNDIERILKFLDHKSTPRWLDYLDNKRKLRNGKIGMNDIKIKKRLI